MTNLIEFTLSRKTVNGLYRVISRVLGVLLFVLVYAMMWLTIINL
jgi:hypothetical protein